MEVVDYNQRIIIIRLRGPKGIRGRFVWKYWITWDLEESEVTEHLIVNSISIEGEQEE